MAYKKLVQSGNLVELYEYEKDPIPHVIRRRSCNHSKCRFKARCTVFVSPYRRSDNLYKTRKSFLRLVRSNLVGVSPALLTLTFVDALPVVSAFKLYTAFIVQLRRKYGTSLKHISVSEFQQRGAIHFHCLIWGLPQYVIVQERNLRRIQRLWGYGTVDLVSTDGSPKLAGYLAKYLSKGMHDSRLLGKKAYCSSRNLLRPVSISSYSFPTAFDIVSKDLGIVDNSLQFLKERVYSTQWQGKATYKLFDTSI